MLERAYRAGVDDIHLIAALALHRRMTPAELQARGGRRACSTRSTPTASTTTTPRTPTASSASARPSTARRWSCQQRRRRVRPARLREHQPRDDGRRPQVGGRRPGHLRARCAPTTTCTRCATRARSWTRRTASCTARAGRQGEIVEAAVPIFHIETTLNNDMFGGPLSLPGQAGGALDAARAGHVRGAEAHADRMPPKARRTLFQRIVAPYAVTGVTAGAVDAGARGDARALRRPAGRRGATGRPTSSPPGCPTSARTTSTRS